jgi:hypothetical protein
MSGVSIVYVCLTPSIGELVHEGKCREFRGLSLLHLPTSGFRKTRKKLANLLLIMPDFIIALWVDYFEMFCMFILSTCLKMVSSRCSEQ